MGHEKRVVVVIGGGLAGMTAAYELSKQGYRPILLERGGHFGGKVMSSEGYGGLPIEHGVHGWWKGYGNFFDLLHEVHGEGWERELFSGPYFSRFTARLSDGRVVSMNRPPPVEGEPRLMPFIRSMLEMIEQGGMSLADAASLVRLLGLMISFDHARDYDAWKDVTASGLCEALGVSKRAQELVVANFTLASAFSPIDRISGSAFLSSANFYILDAQASLAARWLRTHPAKLVHQPLTKAIAAHGEVCPYTRVLGIEKRDGRVDRVIVDRAHAGLLAIADLTKTERDLLDVTDTAWPATPAPQLALARATLHHLGEVWITLSPDFDPDDGSEVPIAWRGDRSRPSRISDARWLKVEWGDADATSVRILEEEYETLGTVDARDVPKNEFRELLWENNARFTTKEALASLQRNLARVAHRMAMHVTDLASPSHLPLYVGDVDGVPRGFAGICTHMGGRVRYDAGLHAFACQLHGSRFSCDGQRICGPAEADLMAFRLVPSASREGFIDVQIGCPPAIYADHVICATDVAGAQSLLQASPSLHGDKPIVDMMLMRTTSVTVVRFVIARRIDDVLGVFAGFSALDALFNVTKLQGVQLDRYRDCVHEVIEIQLYRDRTVGQLSRDPLIAMIKHDLKEAYGWDEEPEILEPIHVAVHRNVYSAYDPESERVRPGTDPKIPGLFFAGDWVQPEEGAWYMERAVRTGRLAARAVLHADGLDQNLVRLVPPVRTPWNLRNLARQGEQGAIALTVAIKKMIGLTDTTL